MQEIIETYFSHIFSEINVWLKTRKNVIKNTFKIILVVLLALISANLRSSWYIFLQIANWKGAIIPWICNYYFAIFFLYPEIKKNFKKELEHELLFFWISLEKFVDFIIEKGTLKTDELMKHFAISRNITNQILEKIDETEIFIRWKNNARILNISFTKSQIVKILLNNEIKKQDEEIIEENESWFYQTKIIETEEIE